MAVFQDSSVADGLEMPALVLRIYGARCDDSPKRPHFEPPDSMVAGGMTMGGWLC